LRTQTTKLTRCESFCFLPGEAAGGFPKRTGTGCHISWHEAAQICSHAVSLQKKLLGFVQKEQGLPATSSGMKLLRSLVTLCHCRRRCCGSSRKSRKWVLHWHAAAQMCSVMLCHCRRRGCASSRKSRDWATSWQAGATGVT